MAPVQSEACRAKSNQAGVNPIQGGRRPAAEVKLDLPAGLSSGHLRPKNLQAELRLAQSRPESRIVVVRIAGHRPTREVQIVNCSAVAEQIQQYETREANSILGGTFYFGLVLCADLALKRLGCFLKRGY